MIANYVVYSNSAGIEYIERAIEEALERRYYTSLSLPESASEVYIKDVDIECDSTIYPDTITCTLANYVIDNNYSRILEKVKEDYTNFLKYYERHLQSVVYKTLKKEPNRHFIRIRDNI